WYGALVAVASSCQEPAWAKACLKAWFVTSLGNRKAVGNRQSTEAFQFRGHETQCFFSLFQRRGRCEALRQPLSQLLPLQLFGHGSKRKHLRRLVAKAHCQASELIFLDNEFQHCQDAADFGSTAVFCPHGLTATCWSDSVEGFPCPGVIIGDQCELQRKMATKKHMFFPSN
ncbi:unnamed protein product, partial [Durusdinium trenchii]